MPAVHRLRSPPLDILPRKSRGGAYMVVRPRRCARKPLVSDDVISAPPVGAKHDGLTATHQVLQVQAAYRHLAGASRARVQTLSAPRRTGLMATTGQAGTAGAVKPAAAPMVSFLDAMDSRPSSDHGSSPSHGRAFIDPSSRSRVSGLLSHEQQLPRCARTSQFHRDSVPGLTDMAAWRMLA